ncbi:MAG: phosphoribosylformylglycinamidine synthase subunit PurL, partial [Bacteroidota bacterium]|nr:phosphoribosylformylglycinamidine synthase subunit PurL [Bacteroidota bacterium]
MLEYYMDGELVAHVPAHDLVLGGGAPVYDRPAKEPAHLKELENFSIDQVSQPADLKEVARFLAGHVNIASRRWIYEQYDSMVQTNTVTTNRPADASVIRLKGTMRSIAASVDCN